MPQQHLPLPAWHDCARRAVLCRSRSALAISSAAGEGGAARQQHLPLPAVTICRARNACCAQLAIRSRPAQPLPGEDGDARQQHLALPSALRSIAPQYPQERAYVVACVAPSRESMEHASAVLALPWLRSMCAPTFAKPRASRIREDRAHPGRRQGTETMSTRVPLDRCHMAAGLAAMAGLGARGRRGREAPKSSGSCGGVGCCKDNGAPLAVNYRVSSAGEAAQW